MLVALAAAILRLPGGEHWQIALPSLQPRWIAALERWVAPAHELDSSELRDDNVAPVCSCDCPAAAVELSDLGLAFLAGIAVWPVTDVLRLFKLAWQRQVGAAERQLQLRPPDRP